MNTAWNLELDDYELDEAIQRGRRRLQDFMSVLTLTAQRRSVSEIAQQLDCSRNRVIWVQHVLSLRTERGKGRGKGLGAWPRSESMRARR